MAALFFFMNASRLIEILSELPPDTEIFYVVDGEAERTGNFQDVEGITEPSQFLKLTYGGYDERKDKSEYTIGEPVVGVYVF